MRIVYCASAKVLKLIFWVQKLPSFMVVRLNSELFTVLKIPKRTSVTVVRVSLRVALIWITPELVKLLAFNGVTFMKKMETFGGVVSTVKLRLDTELFRFPSVSFP